MIDVVIHLIFCNDQCEVLPLAIHLPCNLTVYAGAVSFNVRCNNLNAMTLKVLYCMRRNQCVMCRNQYVDSNKPEDLIC